MTRVGSQHHKKKTITLRRSAVARILANLKMCGCPVWWRVNGILPYGPYQARRLLISELCCSVYGFVSIVLFYILFCV
jgi:hypothetical protein